jgi:putative redox protein
MIVSSSDESRYKTLFTNGCHKSFSDTTSDKGGANSGFRPHDLLEAALACCMNITLRWHADKQGIPLAGVTTEVNLNRGAPDETIFEYKVNLDGPLTDEQRQILLNVAESSHVRRTLSKKISFHQLR